MKKFLPFYFLAVLLLTNCESSEAQKENGLSEEGILKASVLKLLQGKWKSSNDGKAMIEFKDHYFFDYYDHEKLEKNVFELNNSCFDEKPGPTSADDEIYITSNGQCWHVDTVNESMLVLTYEERGNILRYKKSR